MGPYRDEENDQRTAGTSRGEGNTKDTKNEDLKLGSMKEDIENCQFHSNRIIKTFINQKLCPIRSEKLQS